MLEDGRFAVHSLAATAPAIAALAAVLDRLPDVLVYQCDAALLRGVTGFDFHRGCLALAQRAAPMPLPDLAAARRLLALEGVTDPDNVGGLFRTALAFGADAVILDAATADPLYRKAIRTSVAATLRVPFARHGDWRAALDGVRAAGMHTIALTPHPDALPLADYASRAPDRLAIVVGSEGFGMSSESLSRADVRIRIPIDPRADSLNVVSAAAIALYALRPREQRYSRDRC